MISREDTLKILEEIKKVMEKEGLQAAKMLVEKNINEQKNKLDEEIEISRKYLEDQNKRIKAAYKAEHPDA